MTQWFNLLETIKYLNKETKGREFTYKMLEKRIKDGELKAINISFEDSPILRIKKSWAREFKNKVSREKKKSPNIFKPSLEEKEEAIFFSLSKKVKKPMGFSKIREYLPLLRNTEQKVMNERYGLQDQIFKSHERVGKKIGISKQRVRQLEESAIKRIKSL